jgi:hypothetical protein
MAAQNDTTVRPEQSGPDPPGGKKPFTEDDPVVERADPPREGESLLERFLQNLRAALSAWNV